MIKGDSGKSNERLFVEGKTDLAEFLNQHKYCDVVEGNVYVNCEKVGITFKRHGLYKFLRKMNIDWKKSD